MFCSTKLALVQHSPSHSKRRSTDVSSGRFFEQTTLSQIISCCPWRRTSGWWSELLALSCGSTQFTGGLGAPLLGHHHHMGLGPKRHMKLGQAHTGSTLPLKMGVDIYHSYLVTRQIAFFSSQSFSQANCNLLHRTHMLNLDDPSVKLFFDEEFVYFNMFGSIMLHWIVCYINC